MTDNTDIRPKAVTRYQPCHDGDMQPHKSGDWVRMVDYDAVLARAEAAEAKVRHYASLLDDSLGTPCEQIRLSCRIEKRAKEAAEAKLSQAREDALLEVVDLMRDRWAMTNLELEEAILALIDADTPAPEVSAGGGGVLKPLRKAARQGALNVAYLPMCTIRSGVVVQSQSNPSRAPRPSHRRKNVWTATITVAVQHLTHPDPSSIERPSDPRSPRQHR